LLAERGGGIHHPMTKSAAILGTGILGRLLGLALHRRSWAVTLYDPSANEDAAAFGAQRSGVISPCSVLSDDSVTLAELGFYSGNQWPVWLKSLPAPVALYPGGSLTVAHPRDADELRRFHETVLDHAVTDDLVVELRGREIAREETELAGRFPTALFFPGDQQLDRRQLMDALGKALADFAIPWRRGESVLEVTPHTVTDSRGSTRYDWVIDTRDAASPHGISALKPLRAESMVLFAPDVHLTHPVRLMHPRQRMFIECLQPSLYRVGSVITGHDRLPSISARSMLELLSAAHTVHAGFSGAHLRETHVDVSFAGDHDLPSILPRHGLLSIRGVGRHDVLIAPALVDITADFVDLGETHPLARDIMADWEL
jgi:glycine oxidase